MSFMDNWKLKMLTSSANFICNLLNEWWKKSLWHKRVMIFFFSKIRIINNNPIMPETKRILFVDFFNSCTLKYFIKSRSSIK
jgi:hypothetical protein